MDKKITQEQAIRSAMFIGLFNSMIEDIPKIKQESHYKKLDFLLNKGFIHNFDFGENYESKITQK